MAFDEDLADRVRALLTEHDDVVERRMFGGLAFMVAGHMCCGVQDNRLMIRLDPRAADEALARPHVRPMDFTGRPLRGFVYVEGDGLRGAALADWVKRAAAWAGSQPPGRRLR